MASNAIKEINSVRAFFRARDIMGDPQRDTALQKSFADTLIGIINGIPAFGPGEGSIFMDALKDKPYGEAQTIRIFQHIDAKMQGTRSLTGAKLKVGDKQGLKNWWSYCTAADWAKFRDPKASWNCKMTTIVERGMGVGCVDPDEQSLKWAMATLLVSHYTDLPAPQQIYQKLQDLKASYAAERKVFVHEKILIFPDDPNALPAHIFSEAYPDAGGPPIEVHLQGICTIADSIPLRSNSKLLKLKGAARVEAQSAFATCKSEGVASISTPKCEQSSPPYAALYGDNGLPKPTIDITDPDEVAILTEYQFKLKEHRTGKGHALVATGGAIRMIRATDGTLVASGPGAPLIKAEAVTSDFTGTSSLDAQTTLKKWMQPGPAPFPPRPESVDSARVGKPIEVDDLDPYTQAAIKALQVRNQGKKEAAKETKASKTAKKATTPLKRPAAHVATSSAALKKAKTTADIKPEQAVGHAKASPSKVSMPTNSPAKVEVPKSEIMNKMPSRLPADGSNPAPVLYNKGVIYTSRKTKQFRGLSTRGDRYTEVAKAWCGPTPSKEAWVAVVKSIDEKND